MRRLSEPSPTSYLDRVIVRVAVLRARELIAQGRSREEAVRLSCPGSWSLWSGVVRARVERTEQR
jgi:hypothetical protein